MQLKSSLLLLAALAPFSMARVHGHARRQHEHQAKRFAPTPTSTAAAVPSSSSSGSATSSGGSSDWTNTPADGQYSTAGFGGRTSSTIGGTDTYQGNVGNPWGSNIIEVSAADASKYKYVAQIKGQNTEPWQVVFWNKYGPDGKMDGQFGHQAISFTLNAGETKYVAFDENTQGGFGAFGGGSLPTGTYGGYSCTWGEFDFGNADNNNWSGFDVSAIQAQLSGQQVQGMQICDAKGGTCSSISDNAAVVNNAYTKGEVAVGGIGGNLQAGPVRLAVVIDYSG